jgi:site-specific DNA-methyltransferase (adenine-specific)
MTQAFNMDCMVAMKEFPDKFFDLAIVDPPYGIVDTWSKNRNDGFYNKGKHHRYQNEMTPDALYFSELKRVSVNQIIWGGNYFTEHLPPTNSWVVWYKHSNGEEVHMSEAEMAWTSFKKVLRVAKLNWSGGVKCEPGSKVHPHQKPKKLYRFCLNVYAKPGDKILDTHLGSGSSRIAAHDMGFSFWGYELDKDYFDAQEKRFANHAIQLTLFPQTNEAKNNNNKQLTLW